jgi:hypothetical protein
VGLCVVGQAFSLRGAFSPASPEGPVETGPQTKVCPTTLSAPPHCLPHHT